MADAAAAAAPALGAPVGVDCVRNDSIPPARPLNLLLLLL